MESKLAAPSQPWGEAFTLTETDVEFVNNLLLEEGAPMESERLAVAVIRERLQNDAKRRARLSPEDVIYLPRLAYRAGQQLVFPLLGFSRGTVVSIRPGENPEAGAFEVIRVNVDGEEREFASRLENHELNAIPLEILMGGSEQSPEEILREHETVILPLIEARLTETADIAKIADRWFPRSLLVEISHGHLNLAEAVLDVAGGGPLPTSALLEHLELPSSVDPRLTAFSLEHALYRDERFEEVGPAGEMAWFLRRLEPPEVTFPPRRLAYAPETPASGKLPEQMQALAADLEDEWSPAAGPAGEVEEVSLTLTFPHWRVGTLPLNPKLASVFPQAHQATRIRFDFVDSESGERFPGWVVTPFRFVFGLADWYPKKGLLPGGLLRIRRGDQPGEVVLDPATRRPAREWIRTATASPNHRLTFTMQKQAVSVEYDELAVIAVDDLQAVDELWLRMNEQKTPLESLIADVFRELAKLNPQSTVHARTLYNAVNVVRRLPPLPVFAELMQRTYYSHMGDLYYRFDEVKWTETR
ncbi:MAG: hypothetical protein JW929_07480 [Anaerolineales bacterium]|nr:hypothetical protein [Anaerolineales bacterium]